MEQSKKVKINLVSLLVILVFVIFALISGYWFYDQVREKTKEWNITTLEGAAIFSGDEASENPNVDNGQVNTPSDSSSDILVPTLDKWDGNSRVNILILGLDYNDWRTDSEYPLSDSMMLVTFDPINMTAGMISLPRDLWVEIPGFGKNKINQAYFLGEAAKLPGGGAELARLTVEGFLGTKVDYYAVLDFYSFVDFIDLIDGIKITVTEYQVFDLFGSKGKLYLKPEDGAIQSLNGQQALSYARYRDSERGDFDRALKQQEIVFAIRDRLLEPQWQTYLLTHYEEVWDIFKDSVKTNLALDEIIKLGLTAIDVNRDEIKSGVIAPPNMVYLYKSQEGLDILVPIMSNIRILRDEIFSASTITASDLIGGDVQELMSQEGASVAVYNGTYTSGLAGMTQGYLQSFGIEVPIVDDGVQTAYTTIYTNGKVPYTLQFLVDKMHVSSNYIKIKIVSELSADIEVILGSDWYVPTY